MAFRTSSNWLQQLCRIPPARTQPNQLRRTPPQATKRLHIAARCRDAEMDSAICRCQRRQYTPPPTIWGSRWRHRSVPPLLLLQPGRGCLTFASGRGSSNLLLNSIYKITFKNIYHNKHHCLGRQKSNPMTRRRWSSGFFSTRAAATTATAPRILAVTARDRAELSKF